jgi:hypothetical protein
MNRGTTVQLQIVFFRCRFYSPNGYGTVDSVTARDKDSMHLGLPRKNSNQLFCGIEARFTFLGQQTS